MSIYSDITPTDPRDYMKFRGWLQVTEALADGEFLFNHPDSSRQIYFSVHREVPGFEEALQSRLRGVALVGLGRLAGLRKRSGGLRELAYC